MGELAKSLHLPDITAKWPWPRTMNPSYELVKVKADRWIHSFQAFSEKSQYAFDNCNFPLLAALTYPLASEELLYISCNLMSLLFAIDEFTDVESQPDVQEIVDIIIDAIHSPHKPRPREEIILGEMTRQFWEHAVKYATPTAQNHFIETFTAYLNSVFQEAGDREINKILNIDAYFENRRDGAAIRPSFSPLEFELDLSDEFFYHPVIVELTVCATDMIILCNDIVSYNREQATGDPRQNIITVVMHHLKTDIEGALRWVADYHRETELKFLDGLKRVPTWNQEIDHQVHQYLDGIGNWVRGNDCWSFEGGRYFGSKGLDYQKSRLVPLAPKVIPVEGSSRGRESTVVYLVDELYLE